MKEAFVLALATMLAAGCSGSAPTPTATQSASPSPTPAAVLTATPVPTSTPTAAPSLQPATATPTATPEAAGIPVSMGGATGRYGIELFFLPKAITVPAGDSAFVLKNQTLAPHNMVIGPEAPTCSAGGCDFGTSVSFSATIAPNAAGLFVAEDLAAGTYSYWCSIQDHAQLGMVGVLTVQP